MIDATSSLPDILDHVWGLLVRGGADKKHAYHFPVLATQGQAGVQQRTVVLRKTIVADSILRAYSDARTLKVSDLQANPTAHWLFYDHSSKEQIRVRGRATLHQRDELAETLWNSIPPGARGDYVGPVPPGTRTEGYTDNLPNDFREEPTEENTQAGFANFVVIDCEVTAIDYLRLRRGGHLRAQFIRENDAWNSYWTAP